MPETAPKPRSHWLLRRADQAVVATCIAAAAAAMAIWWTAQGGWRGRLLDIDRSAPQTAGFQVDINHADWAELAQLPGVGETLAHRIIESRLTDGPFRDHRDLRRVRGIGAKTLEKLRPYLAPLPDQDAVAGR